MNDQIQLIRDDVVKIQENVDRRINAQHKLINSEVVVLKDYDIKINTLIDLCIKASVFTQGDFEIITDMRRGLRLMGPEEPIALKDIVWVNYKAKIEKPDGTFERDRRSRRTSSPHRHQRNDL